MNPGGVQIAMTGTGTSGSIIGIVANDTITHFPALYLRSVRARGTMAAPTVVQNDDLLSFWEAEAWTGSARCPVANVGMFATGVSGSNVGGYTNFLISNVGACSPLERLRITTSGIAVPAAHSITAPIFASLASSILSITSNVIAPTNGIHHVGAGLVKSITVPATCTPTCSVMIIPDAAFTTDATGNISLASTAVINRALIFVWDGTKWNPSY